MDEEKWWVHHAVALLKELEWGEESDDGKYFICSCCKQAEHNGHDENCILSLLLTDKETIRKLLR